MSTYLIYDKSNQCYMKVGDIIELPENDDNPALADLENSIIRFDTFEKAKNAIDRMCSNNLLMISMFEIDEFKSEYSATFKMTMGRSANIVKFNDSHQRIDK